MKLLVAVSEVVLAFTVGPQHTSFSDWYQTHHTELFHNSEKQNKMTKKNTTKPFSFGICMNTWTPILWVKEQMPYNSLCHSSSQFHKCKWQVIPAPSTIYIRYIDPERLLLVMSEAVSTGLQRNAKSDIRGLLNILHQVLSWCKLAQLHGNK